MLDNQWLRGDLTALEQVLASRGYTLAVDFWQTLEQKRKSLQLHTEALQAQKNQGAKQIGEYKREGKNTDDLMAQMSAVSEQMKQAEHELKQLQEIWQAHALAIPNLPADGVPVGADEDDNVEVYRWGVPRNFDFTIKDHTDLGEAAGGLDFATAAKLTGSRFSLLSGELAKLNRALAQFMLDTHTKNGYTEMYVPYIVNADSLHGTGQLPKFAEDLFALKDSDYYLIPTSEVVLTNVVRDCILSLDELPIKLTAHTPCFRSEAGSAGRDTRGLIRQHQFDKVEMVQIVHPDQSMIALDEMVGAAQELLEALELPYRTVLLCTKDMGFSAAKTYDIEVWLPSQNTYREISSVSNCTDFQARRMSVRLKEGKKTTLIHTLNGSGLAIGRTLLAILENHQNADGSVAIPKALQSYMGVDTIFKS